MGLIDWKAEKELEKAAIERGVKEVNRKAEWERTHVCKQCKKIFNEGIPYQKTFWGNTKNYVCTDCAKGLGLN